MTLFTQSTVSRVVTVGIRAILRPWLIVFSAPSGGKDPKVTVQRGRCILKWGFRLHYDQVSVGDVVLLKNPLESDKLIVRRLAALGGQQMVSTDEKDEPFFTDYDECWVLSDNNKLTAKEAKDSRTFGPVSLMDIMGRVLYRFRSIHDHGVVNNSNTNAKEDSAVVRFELDLNEMQKISEA
ncbi:mitochondrial ATP-independent inner membrane protease subunit 2-like isoform X2 [Amaranthus tricolor]|uniref:mitochondrial ATP-independent inner membrane protease subunit 2-like isoform X2 n=1 Tax=Amaranthus tricolor TaxID=29722 RepID=UPI002586535C|nr:mitochondrial ATP-independent inner membrane protease subunit 2-like isoform X2 [Amaranthus tricolor]XP_057546979.1 mitochondrial ATP-independent inner membrane protease subunit 2-like isoform X2 [Amaranthus tricolor]XP_057546980.1 mitochondrial ATP-independent inner membrane protease subunit 2-like isoform X2 [Amaranthus tricolor]